MSETITINAKDFQRLREDVRHLIKLVTETKAEKAQETWITGRELRKRTGLTNNQIQGHCAAGNFKFDYRPNKRYLLQSIPEQFIIKPATNGKN